jgi:hypothetical protein
MKHVFISHATADDTFVKALREDSEHRGLTILVDSRDLFVVVTEKKIRFINMREIK